MLPVLDTGHDLPFCCPITPPLFGDHDAGRPLLLLQQLPKEPLGGLLITSALDQHVEHHPGLVNCAPEPMLHPGDLDDYLVEVPFVANAGQPALDLTGKCLAELERPLPHGLVADDGAACSQ